MKKVLERIDELDQKFGKFHFDVEERFASVEEKIESNHLASEMRFASVEEKIESNHLASERRFIGLEHSSHKMGLEFEELKQNQRAILDAVLSIDSKLEHNNAILDRIDNHEHRISAVEYIVRTYPD